MQVDFAMIERARSTVALLNRKARIPVQNPIARRNPDPFRESENNGSPLVHPQISAKQRNSSLVVLRPNPSAIFAGTDAEAPLSCEIIPNRSDLGNLEVNLYTIIVSSCDLSAKPTIR